MTEGEFSVERSDPVSRLFPRRYRRFRDLRTYEAACDWSRTLDWQRSTYDRFLLERELLRYLEATQCYLGQESLFRIASREVIGSEIGLLLDEYAARPVPVSVFAYVLIMLPGVVGRKCGRRQQSRLTQVLADLPSSAKS